MQFDKSNDFKSNVPLFTQPVVNIANYFVILFTIKVRVNTGRAWACSRSSYITWDGGNLWLSVNEAKRRYLITRGRAASQGHMRHDTLPLNRLLWHCQAAVKYFFTNYRIYTTRDFEIVREESGEWENSPSVLKIYSFNKIKKRTWNYPCSLTKFLPGLKLNEIMLKWHLTILWII